MQKSVSFLATVYSNFVMRKTTEFVGGMDEFLNVFLDNLANFTLVALAVY